MGRKHRSVYQDHINYVCNDIVKPFKFKILCYAERVREMHDLAKYLPPPSMKGESKMAAKWSVRNEQFTNSDLQRSIKDGVPPKIMDELDDNIEDYRSLTYEYWCDLLSTIEVKDERKRAAVYIKKIASTRPASPSDSDESVSIMRRKKAKTGVQRSNNSPISAHDRHHGAHRYYVIFKKAVIPEQKYMSHSAEDCTGVRTKRSIKDGMGGPIGSSTHAVQQHMKSEKQMEEGSESPQES